MFAVPAAWVREMIGPLVTWTWNSPSSDFDGPGVNLRLRCRDVALSVLSHEMVCEAFFPTSASLYSGIVIIQLNLSSGCGKYFITIASQIGVLDFVVPRFSVTLRRIAVASMPDPPPNNIS